MKSQNDPRNIKLKKSNKYLIFTLGEEEFALAISQLKEIKGSKEAIAILPIASAPEHIRGVLQFEKSVIPVVDMRVIYKLKPINNGVIKVLLIIQYKNVYVGLIVHSVSEIIELDPNAIEAPADFLSLLYHNYIEGVATYENRILMILNTEKLIDDEELHIIKHYSG